MASVPGVLREVLIQPPGSGLGMKEPALEIGITQGFEQVHPTHVQGFQKIEGWSDRQGIVGQHRPTRFVVRFDGGQVFRKRELKTDESIHVTFGHMMHDLPHGPAARPVGSVELFFGETGHSGAQVIRGPGDFLNPGAAFPGRSGTGKGKRSDRVLEVWHVSW